MAGIVWARQPGFPTAGGGRETDEPARKPIRRAVRRDGHGRRRHGLHGQRENNQDDAQRSSHCPRPPSSELEQVLVEKVFQLVRNAPHVTACMKLPKRARRSRLIGRLATRGREVRSCRAARDNSSRATQREASIMALSSRAKHESAGALDAWASMPFADFPPNMDFLLIAACDGAIALRRMRHACNQDAEQQRDDAKKLRRWRAALVPVGQSLGAGPVRRGPPPSRTFASYERAPYRFLPGERRARRWRRNRSGTTNMSRGADRVCPGFSACPFRTTSLRSDTTRSPTGQPRRLARWPRAQPSAQQPETSGRARTARR